MSEMLAWLKATIEGDKAAAEVADMVAPGPWVNRGQAGEGDAWQVHGALTDDSETEWDEALQDVVNIGIRVATLNYDDGGGVWKREAADHMCRHDPQDTIARCKEDLAIIALHDDLHDCVTETGSQVFPAGDRDEIACPTLRRLAAGRRHREGFNPDWVSD